MDKYINNTDQIYGITPSILQEGKKHNTFIYHVRTGSGLEYIINRDRCLDITRLTYKGMNISYQGREGIINSAYARGNERGAFNGYYHGGMLYTCGLKNVGPECYEGGIFYPTHGFIGTIPANNTGVYVGNDYLLVTGEMYETALFSSNLVLKRQIKSKVFSDEIEIKDIIKNNGNKDEIIFYLYHFNLGYPFLDESLELIIDDEEVNARDKYSLKNIEYAKRFISPQDDIEESVFFHKIKSQNGICQVKAVNQNKRIQVIIEYENKYLPNFVQWYSPVSHDYAMGLEPTNSFVRGRDKEIKADNMPIIKKGEEITVNLKLTVSEIKKPKH